MVRRVIAKQHLALIFPTHVQACLRVSSANTFCRFFTDAASLRAAMALHADPLFAPMLPALLHTHPEHGCTLHGSSGSAYAFPPFFARQQGITVRKWFSQAGTRSASEVRGMLMAVTTHLAALHASGRALGGLRADLVIFFEASSQWHLLGMSRAAAIGANPTTSELF